MLSIDLNGLWDFIVDLDPKYHNSSLPAYARPGWDRSRWQKVPVPGVWNKYSERLDIYEGVCWFAREFAVDSLPETQVAILRFGGINYKCRIFLNNKYVGSHEGGYTEFTVDVSNEIQTGKNLLAIEVDNRATQIKLPPCLGYFNYGGIHRDVALEIHPQSCYMKDVFLDAKPSVNGGFLRATGQVVGCNERVGVRLLCNGVEAYVELKDDKSYDINMSVPGVSSWSPTSPNLYPAEVQLLQDDEIVHKVSYEVGFRSIQIIDGDILLNGESIFLNGVCYLYDSPVYGVTMKPEQYLIDIALFKEMGINTIRSHFPFTKAFYEACDKAGIMIWIETPIYCIHPPDNKKGTEFSDPEFKKLAGTMIEEMIIHARSHPCVIIYSLGNECNVTNPEAETFFRELSEKVRELDNTRLISYASLYCNVGPLADMVDILGINEYWGWYDIIDRHDSTPGAIDLKVLDDKIHELKQIHKKPMLLTEFGADSIPGYLSKSCDLWSEDYHANLLHETYSIITKHEEIRGIFPFCFSDYRDPSKYVNKYWNEMNYKGVVTYERRPKKAFYVLKGIYKDENKAR